MPKQGLTIDRLNTLDARFRALDAEPVEDDDVIEEPDGRLTIRGRTFEKLTIMAELMGSSVPQAFHRTLREYHSRLPK